MFLNELRGLGSSDYVVSLDMDGVLADFSAKVEEVFGKPIEALDSRTLWSGITRYDKEVEPFFENLPMMNDARELINFVDANFKKWNILSAGGYTPKNVAEQKKRWIAKVISPRVDVIVVQKSNEKANYAGPKNILVDDRMKSIGPWRSAGGIGILHTSAKTSIEELKPFIPKSLDNR